MGPSGGTPRVVSRAEALLDVARDATHVARLAVDLEASGMFTYRAHICTMQLAWDRAEHVVVIDALSAPVGALGQLLGERGPVKIVHDVAFDARLLAEVGIDLANVHDTAVAARMLGRAATGLAALLESELGIHIAKEMQQHDWRVRPFDAAMLSYLATDVAHLEALEEKIWREVVDRGIEDEVLEETRYRLGSAAAAARAPQVAPAYARMKGIERLPERERAILRVLAEIREREAQRRDVPPYRVASTEALAAAARARPGSTAELARVRGFSVSSPAARAFAEEIVSGIASAGEVLPEAERARFERPRLPDGVLRARREREARLLTWRRAEAKRRGVDEQVILPGHCVKDTVEADPSDADGLGRVPGIGSFRIERDATAILRALRGDGGGP